MHLISRFSVFLHERQLLSPSEKGIYSKGTNLLPNPLRLQLTSFSEGRQTILPELSPLAVY